MNHSEYIRIVPGAECAVLMVHGIVSTPRHFDFLLPTIPENWTVANLLLDGHGGTVRDFSKTSMKKWKAQVGEWMEKLCATHSRVLIVGYSLGTLLTMCAAQNRPQVKAMLLLNPPLKPRLHPKMIPISLRFAFGKVKKDVPAEAALWEDIGVTLEPWLHKYLGWIPRFVELLILCRQCCPIAEKIPVPCHAFLGRKDELVSLKSQKHLQCNPNITLHFMDCAGHSYYPPEDQAQMKLALQELLQLTEQVGRE